MLSVLPDGAIVKYNGVNVTDSLVVADEFDKRHDHVLRGIEKMILDLKALEVANSPEAPKTVHPEEWLFIESEYRSINNLGHTVRKKKYLITEEGLNMLAGEYTGDKARAVRYAFTKAFKRLREENETYSEALQLLLPDTELR